MSVSVEHLWSTEYCHLKVQAAAITIFPLYILIIFPILILKHV